MAWLGIYQQALGERKTNPPDWSQVCTISLYLLTAVLKFATECKPPNVSSNTFENMVEKISRDLCLVKYRTLPLAEYDKEIDDDLVYHPEVHYFYWLKLKEKLDENSAKNLPKEIKFLIEKLNINTLIFLGEMNKPWISKYTEKRTDHKPLVKAIEYFKKHKIEKRFSGAVKVTVDSFEEFIRHFYIVTECDGGFFNYNFVDEKQNFVFYIHYSGEVKVFILNENANELFLKEIKKTSFVDSQRENTNRIK